MVALDNRLIVVAAMAAALVFGALSPVIGMAQDATPEAGAAAAGIPNHIHSGTCEELGDVVAPLAELRFEETDGAMDAMATPMADAATPMMAMAAGSVPVAVSVTNVEMSLDEILAAPHAFNAHDPNDPSIYIACGNITGTPDEQGNLFVGVAEDSDSGLSGVVWLIDDGTGAGTVVTVFLVGEFESTARPADEGATPVG
jgi:hypothetical protein